MIDFVKIKYRDKEKLKKFILQSTTFDAVNDVVDINTGELRDFLSTKLGVLDIRIFNNSAYIQNSLHKQYNFLKTGVSHNHDDFSYSKLCEIVDYLVSNLVDLENTYLTQFEFGFNLIINNPPEVVIRRNVLLHKKIAGSVNNFYGKGEYKQFAHSNFIIKAYDKGKQFGLSANTMRLEIKFIRRYEFLKLGISNVQDFKNKAILSRCFIYFIMRFDELVIVDNFDESTICNLEDYLKLNKYTNHLFWSEELKNHHPQKVARYRKDFSGLLRKYDLLQTRDYLRKLLFLKFEQLMKE
jgi:hypothetical protein